MLKKLWSKKIVRFLCVGIWNTLLDMSILNLLVFLVHTAPLVANFISATISIIISYFLNHHFVFRSKEKHSLSQFSKFLIVTGISVLIVQSVIIYVVMYVLKHDATLIQNLLRGVGLTSLTPEFVNLNVAKVCAVGGGMVWNFILYHYVVFKKYPTKDASEELAEALV